MITYLKRFLGPLGRSSAIAALSAAALAFPAASSAQAQIVAVGHGTYEAFTQPSILEFTFLVKQTSNGSTQGLAVWKGPESVTVWNVSSAMKIDDTVLFAGEILWTLGTPPPGQEVGVTAFTAVKDNGPGFTDETASLSVVPAAFGNPTIQEIVAFIGPPPPAGFRTLLTGNIFTP
jgi:hypothetical protein